MTGLGKGGTRSKRHRTSTASATGLRPRGLLALHCLRGGAPPGCGCPLPPPAASEVLWHRTRGRVRLGNCEGLHAGDAGWLPPLGTILRILVIAYAGYLLLIFVVQRSVVFPGGAFPSPRASPVDVPPGVEQTWLEASFGRVEAWLLAARAPSPILVFAHGNGELIEHWVAPMERFRAAGVSVLLVEFPGYGHSDGKPTRATLAETFERAFDHLTERPGIDPARIVAVGRSLGAGAAADLVRARPVAALVLISSLSSATDLACPFVVRDCFDVAGAVRGFDGPVLLMHGMRDEVLPLDHARRIAEARPGLAVTPLDCGHNDCLTVWPETAASLVPSSTGTACDEEARGGSVVAGRAP